MLGAGLVVGALLFRELLTLLVAVLITVLVAIPLSAATSALERRRVPRAIGAPAALVVALAALGGLLALLIPSFVDQVNTFVDESPHIVASLERQVHDLTGAEPADVGDRVQHALRTYVDDPDRLIGPIASIGLTLVGALGGLVVVLVTALLIAIRPGPLVDGVLRLLRPVQRRRGARVLARLRTAYLGWLRGLVVIPPGGPKPV
jgi:predicted PurR-regulated permease PerM